ncbi:serine hydrolase [Aurantiacibacter spongiae]|uniref:Serine hydrolase n=1 Tax=Aurantiacibacter spongiae TaxID=2488860 RepID=A0A3N5DT47_9SPHN|nr:serine hydrolase [Aurantiacibacter spongiae]RPF72501.1 serine hydrolase [Aurantiacibacter spongiae]
MFRISRTLPALVALALAGCGTADEPRQPYGVTLNGAAPTPASSPAAAPEPPPPPPPPAPYVEDARADLAQTIDSLGEDFGGLLGIAVEDVDAGWTTAYNGERMLPQQSVSKFWVSLTALDQADRGELDLDRTIVLTRKDLTLFHQPIRAEILLRGSVRTTPRELMEQALTHSDNTANNAILEAVGGPAAVSTMMARHDITGVRFGTDEITKQSMIAGVDWKPRYSIANAFFDARDKVPEAKRRAAFEAYLDDPIDGATPLGMVHALSRLARGELLSERSTRLMIETLKRTHSGPRRLRGGREGDWVVAHKTGTGQFFEGRQSGYNDVGLVISPGGRTYAVAVLIGWTRRPTIERMAMMQKVTRAVIAFDEALQSGKAQGESAAEADS